MAPAFFQALVLALAATATLSSAQREPASRGDGKWVSPKYPSMYEVEVPVPDVIGPTYTRTINGTTINYYTLTVDQFEQQIYPDLGKATFVGYNGKQPGPTFKVERGTESIVRVINNIDHEVALHLHGAWTRAPWDGWAEDVVQPGQFKDYYYTETNSARTLWYHDHADGYTAVDAYYGQAGFHIIHDAKEDSLCLPSGDYDIPLAIIDRRYQENGDLVSPQGENLNFFGDVIHVNGQPWPYVNVEPRKYRLRLLNSGLSRAYNLSFSTDDGETVEKFNVIASDAGLFGAPVESELLTLAMGERYEVVFDFAGYERKNITLRNDMMGFRDIEEFDMTNQIMRFVVGKDVSDEANNELPETLPGPDDSRQLPPAPYPEKIDQTFDFARNGDTWTINGVSYNDVNNRLLARQPMGTIERWRFRYVSGPGIHPVHLHLIDFMIVDRTGGARPVLPYEKAGLKDVAFMATGETIDLIAFFGPWNGEYQFHCHNFVHEDNGMMVVYNNTVLEDLGYDVEETFAFGKPQDPRYAAKDYAADKYENEEYITEELMPKFVNSGAYRKIDEVLDAENEYFNRAMGGGDVYASRPSHGRMA